MSVLAEFVALIRPQVDQGSISATNNAMANIGKSVNDYFGGIAKSTGRLISDTLGPLAIVMGAISFAKQVTEAAYLGDELDKASQKIGSTVNELQALRAFANEADVSTEQLQMGMRRLNVALAQAANGSKAFREVLPGEWWKDQNGKTKTSYEMFKQLSGMFANTTNEAQKVLIAYKLMGRSGPELIQALNKGPEALDAMFQKLGQYGVLVGDGVQASKELDDATKDLNFAWQGLKLTLAKGIFTKALTSAINTVAGALRAISSAMDKIRDNSNAARWVFVGFATAATLATVAFMHSLYGTYAALAALTGLQLGGMVRVLWSMAAAGWGAVAPLIPYLALATLIGLIVEDIAGALNGDESLFSGLAEDLDPLLALFGDIWHLISNITDPAAWSVVGDSIVAMFNKVAAVFDNIPILGDLIKGYGAAAGQFYKVGGAAVDALKGGPAKPTATMSSMTPQASIPPPPMSMMPKVNAPQSTVNVTVNATPGMDEQMLAKYVSKEVAEQNMSTLKNASSGLKVGN